MNIDQRLARISNTSHLVFLDDLSIHKIDSFEILDDNIFIETNTGFLFRDVDVFTLEEAHVIELKVKQLLDECA